MKPAKLNHMEAPSNCWTALERVSKTVWALENAKPQLTRVLLAGPDHPAFHSLQIELGNLDYALRSLPVERGADGRPVHPADAKRGAQR